MSLQQYSQIIKKTVNLLITYCMRFYPHLTNDIFNFWQNMHVHVDKSNFRIAFSNLFLFSVDRWFQNLCDWNEFILTWDIEMNGHEAWAHAYNNGKKASKMNLNLDVDGHLSSQSVFLNDLFWSRGKSLQNIYILQFALRN